MSKLYHEMRRDFLGEETPEIEGIRIIDATKPEQASKPAKAKKKALRRIGAKRAKK